MSDEIEQDPRDPRADSETDTETGTDVTVEAGEAGDASPDDDSVADGDDTATVDATATDDIEAGDDQAPDDVAPVSDGDDGFSAPAELELHSEPAEPGPLDDGAGAAPERPRMPVDQLKAIVESLVYASPEPLTAKMLFKLLADEPKEDVQAALDALVVDYDRPGGLHLAQVAGGYQITTRPELHDWVRRLFHERSSQKLSVAALETLSVVAYRQPVTAAEANEIRGVNTSGVLSTLVERQLVKIVGRKNVVGRPFLYGTTKEFLVRFGLKDLNDLPNIQDMVQALGFDAPSALFERPAVDEMLPLDDDDTPPTPAGD